MTYEEWGERLGEYSPETWNMYTDWAADRDYQRRHRKWALKKMRIWRRLCLWNLIGLEEQRSRAQAAEAEVERLRRHQDSGPITERDYLTALEHRAEAAEHKAQLAQTAWANAGVRAQQAEAELERMRLEHDYEITALDDARKAAEAERDKLAGELRLTTAPQPQREAILRVQRDKLAERVRVLAAFIVAREPYHGYDPDHACAECVPGGEMVRPGFRCGFHEAVAALEEEKR